MNQPQFCHIASAMEILSKRWVIIIIHKLLNGPKRFSEIEGELAISGRILSERLKELELAGIVHRKLFPEVPLRVEYTLTEKGKAMEPVVTEIQKWSMQWSSAGHTSCEGLSH